MKIICPSSAAEKYSALLCPKWWFLSAGIATTLSAMSTATAATRLTTDSAASESSPTEPVICHAMVLSVIVAIGRGDRQVGEPAEVAGLLSSSCGDGWGGGRHGSQSLKRGRQSRSA